MGNLQKTLKENEHLKNQNKGLLDALRRRNSQLEEYKSDSTKALAEISELTASYIGAMCLFTEGHEIKLLHADIKRVIAEFDVEIELSDDGIIFKLVKKNED